MRDLGWEFIVNPIVDLSFAPAGDAAFAPAARVARNVTGDTWLGVEYYASYSPVDAMPPVAQQQHTLFVAADFKVLGLDVHLGMGFGLTSASDSLATR